MSGSTAPRPKADEAEFIMLRDGKIAFEGNAAELRAASETDQYMRRSYRRYDRSGINRWHERIHSRGRNSRSGSSLSRPSASQRCSSSPSAAPAGFPGSATSSRRSFTDVNGLKSGAVVRIAGVEVGKVSDVALSGAEVEVASGGQEGNEQRITSDSRASIGSLSLLGEPVIDISPAIDRNAAQGR